MPEAVVRRATILIPGTGGRDNPDGAHLHVVLTDTCQGGYNLLVPICSIKPHRKYDRTCLLGVGDHDFLTHPSYVAYYRMVPYAASVIRRHLDAKFFKLKDPIVERAFALICAGVQRSQESAPRYQRYFSTGSLE